jgi:hypothetical protein
MTKNEEFEKCMGDPTMPDDSSPDYDEWLFSKGYDARQPEIDALKAKNDALGHDIKGNLKTIVEFYEENVALKDSNKRLAFHNKNLQAEVERLRKDAERYRWLREHVAEIDFWGDEFVLDREQLDEHIDAAMKETK